MKSFGDSTGDGQVDDSDANARDLSKDQTRILVRSSKVRSFRLHRTGRPKIQLGPLLRPLVQPRWLLPLGAITIWIVSYSKVLFALFPLGNNDYVGVYVFPGVVEMGVYHHEVITVPNPCAAASTLPDGFRRFQGIDGSVYCYDCISLIGPHRFYSRNVPLVEEKFAVGAHRSTWTDAWTPSRFYWNSGRWRRDMAYHSTHLGIPLAAICAALSLPLVWHGLRALRRRRRLASGRCPECGYDLTGNISLRCPECGTPFEPESCSW